MVNEVRYQVFVSSTFLDLKEERQAVIQTLLESDAFPAGMEMFPASDDDAWTLIQRVIDESDYYILVIGGKYGSVDPIEQLSYTEKEYRYAISQGKPVMAFLPESPDDLPVKSVEIETEAREKLETFKQLVQQAKHVKYWHSADHLAGQVSRSFTQIVKLRPSPGWIRGDTAASAEILAELNDAKRKISDLEARQPLPTSPPEGTDHLAQGEESFAAELVVSGILKTPSKTYNFERNVDAPIPWDDLFGALAPAMLDECAEPALRNRAGKTLEFYAPDPSAATLESFRTENSIPEIDDPATSVKVRAVSMDSDDFGTMLVQFQALGLIQKSDRKRSVQDRGTYWTLTPYGEKRTVQLRAIKRETTN